MEENKHVIFNVGDGEFGISILDVKSIERQMQIVPVPDRPSYLLGIVNLRGNFVPVFSLRDKFGLDDSIQGESKVIVTKSNGVTIALKVDEVSEIVDVPVEEQYDLPIVAANEETTYINKVARIDKRLVILLNMNGVLNEEEVENIQRAIEEME